MNIFGIGLPEMAVIAAIGLLVFGPKRLPELGRTLGRTLRGFQSASSGFEREFRTAINTFEASVAEAEGEAAAADPSRPASESTPSATAPPLAAAASSTAAAQDIAAAQEAAAPAVSSPAAEPAALDTDAARDLPPA